MSDLSEVKNLIDEQGRAWQEFKRANDELIKAKADGKAVSDLESKLAVMSEVLDESKARADALVEDIKRLNRPAAAGADAAPLSDKDGPAEVGDDGVQGLAQLGYVHAVDGHWCTS